MCIRQQCNCDADNFLLFLPAGCLQILFEQATRAFTSIHHISDSFRFLNHMCAWRMSVPGRLLPVLRVSRAPPRIVGFWQPSGSQLSRNNPSATFSTSPRRDTSQPPLPTYFSGVAASVLTDAAVIAAAPLPAQPRRSRRWWLLGLGTFLWMGFQLRKFSVVRQEVRALKALSDEQLVDKFAKTDQDFRQARAAAKAAWKEHEPFRAQWAARGGSIQIFTDALGMLLRGDFKKCSRHMDEASTISDRMDATKSKYYAQCQLLDGATSRRTLIASVQSDRALAKSRAANSK